MFKSSIAGFVALGLMVMACGGSTATVADAPQAVEEELQTGGVVFHVPLLDANDHKPLSRHNAELAAKGLETFPDAVDVTPKTLAKNWERFFDVIDAANAGLGTKMELTRSASPVEFGSALCYRGNPRSVAKAMRALNDSVFSEFITVYRWKLNKESHLTDAWSSVGKPENTKKYPAAFTAFDGHGEDVMLVVTSDDDLDDGKFEASLIPSCK